MYRERPRILSRPQLYSREWALRKNCLGGGKQVSAALGFGRAGPSPRDGAESERSAGGSNTQVGSLLTTFQAETDDVFYVC